MGSKTVLCGLDALKHRKPQFLISLWNSFFNQLAPVIDVIITGVK
jgi:hypothetical protein